MVSFDEAIEDQRRAADLRSRAQRLRQQAERLALRAEALAPADLGGYLGKQAEILESGARDMEAEALRLDPPVGEA